MMVMMMVIVVVTSAGALFSMVVVILVIVVMILVVMVMMIMVMIVAFMIMLVLMMVMFMVMFVIIFMMMFMLVLLHDLLHELRLKILGILYSLKYLPAVKHIPRGRYYRCLGIMLPYKFNTGVYLLIAHLPRTTQDYRSGMLYLVLEEFTEIPEIRFALFGINYCNCRI